MTTLTQLLEAIERNQQQKIRSICRNSKRLINLVREDGRNALMRAAELGRLNCIIILMNAGSNPYHDNSHGYRAHHFAVSTNQYQALDLLITLWKQKDPDSLYELNSIFMTRDGVLKTACQQAVDLGHVESLVVLLNHGASLDGVILSREMLNVALAFANKHLYDDAFKVLIDLGATLEAKQSEVGCSTVSMPSILFPGTFFDVGFLDKCSLLSPEERARADSDNLGIDYVLDF